MGKFSLPQEYRNHKKYIWVGGFWILLGIFLLFCAFDEFSGAGYWKDSSVYFSEIIRSLFPLLLGILVIIGGGALLKRKKWGRPLTILLSIFLILYSLAYCLMGDGEMGVAGSIVILLILPLITIYNLVIMLSRKGREEYKVFIGNGE